MQPGLFVPVMGDRGKAERGGWGGCRCSGSPRLVREAWIQEDVWDSCRAVTRTTSLEYIKLIPCFLYSASIREMITRLKTESEDCS